MKRIKRLLQRPKNSFYLGLLVGLLSLISLLFPLIQAWTLIFTVDLWQEFVVCRYCLLTNLKYFYCVFFILWTIYCAYKVSTHKTYRPLRISLYMLIGYLSTINFISLIFEKEAMRSDDGMKYLFLYSIGPIASLTPIFYGLIFYLIARRQSKNSL